MIKIGHKIRVDTNSLGLVLLRPVTIADMEEIAPTIYIEDKPVRDIIQEVVFHQIEFPLINFCDFMGIPDVDKELLVEKFARFSKIIPENAIRSNDIYRDVHLGLLRQLDELMKWPEVLAKEIARTMTAMQSEIQAIQGSFEANIKEFAKAISPSVQEIKDSINNYMIWIQEQVRCIRENLQQWGIAEIQAAQILQKYGYFICPGMPIAYIAAVIRIEESAGKHEEEFDTLFYDYFQRNNWEILESMVEGWVHKPLFQKRREVLKNCVMIFKQYHNEPICLVILPTLIAQIEGLWTDFLIDKGILPGETFKIRKKQFRDLDINIMTTEMERIAKGLFLDVLFQNTRGVSVQGHYFFNRHKILHGEYTDYGRIDYVIRAFMILNYIGWLE